MTDAIIDNQPLTRSTDLPAEEVQTQEAATNAQYLEELFVHPGWRIVEEKLEGYYQRYRTPQFPSDMPYEEVGKEYLLSQRMAQMIKEILDDVRQDA